MAFVYNDFGTLGGMGKRDESFQLFSYITTDDFSVVSAAGYFNALRGKISKKDLIQVLNKSGDGSEEIYFLEIASTPISGNITTTKASVSPWEVDASGNVVLSDPTNPVIIGSGGLTVEGDQTINGSLQIDTDLNVDGDATFNGITDNDLTASLIVHTDANKKLASVAINTAYNKNFGATAGDVAGIDAGGLGNSEVVLTNASGELTTETKNTAHNKNYSTTATDIKMNGTQALGSNDTLARSDHVHPSDTTKTDKATLTTKGDLYVRNSSNVTRLGVGSDNQFLIADSAEALGVRWATRQVGLPAGYINGLITSNDTDTNHDINITAGKARSSDDTDDIILGTEITKKIDANWSAGDDAGGFPSSLTLSADTWYHIFVIAKADGTTDAGFDTSLSATNLLSDASGYTKYRRIGSVLTDASSNILGFTQNGDYFELDFYVQDISTTNPGTSAITETITTPIGISTRAIITFGIIAGVINSEVYSWIKSLDQTDAAASASNFDLLFTDVGGDNGSGSIVKEVKTNTSSQVQYRLSLSASSTNVYMITHGWVDLRGKE